MPGPRLDVFGVVLMARQPQIDEQQKRADGNRGIRRIERREFVRPEEDLEKISHCAAKQPVPDVAACAAEYQRQSHRNQPRRLQWPKAGAATASRR